MNIYLCKVLVKRLEEEQGDIWGLDKPTLFPPQPHFVWQILWAYTHNVTYPLMHYSVAHNVHYRILKHCGTLYSTVLFLGQPLHVLVLTLLVQLKLYYIAKQE